MKKEKMNDAKKGGEEENWMMASWKVSTGGK